MTINSSTVINPASKVREGRLTWGPDSSWHLALEPVLVSVLLTLVPVQE